MNLRQLELLRAVIKCETTIGAGRELGLSQPAVSNAIKHMEAQVGFPLFERINNRLVPTGEAMTLYRDSEPIFTLHAALELKLQDLKENRSGHVRIVATPPLGYSVIPTALKRFLTKLPNIRVSIDIRNFESVLESVDNGTAELGFVMALDDDAPMLETETFFDGPMVCVMPPDHPLAGKDVIEPADLTASTFISLARETRMGRMVRGAFAAEKTPFGFSVEVRYCHAACLLVDSGVGIAIVDPLSPRCGQYANLIVRRFGPDLRVTASAIISKKRPLSRPAKAFLKEMRVISSDVAKQLV